MEDVLADDLPDIFKKVKDFVVDHGAKILPIVYKHLRPLLSMANPTLGHISDSVMNAL